MRGDNSDWMVKAGFRREAEASQCDGRKRIAGREDNIGFDQWNPGRNQGMVRCSSGETPCSRAWELQLVSWSKDSKLPWNLHCESGPAIQVSKSVEAPGNNDYWLVG